MKKKVYRALHKIAEKVLDEKEMKELDKEINKEVDKAIKEVKDLKPNKKKSDK